MSYDTLDYVEYYTKLTVAVLAFCIIFSVIFLHRFRHKIFDFPTDNPNAPAKLKRQYTYDKNSYDSRNNIYCVNISCYDYECCNNCPISCQDTQCKLTWRYSMNAFTYGILFFSSLNCLAASLNYFGIFDSLYSCHVVISFLYITYHYSRWCLYCVLLARIIVAYHGTHFKYSVGQIYFLFGR